MIITHSNNCWIYLTPMTTARVMTAARVVSPSTQASSPPAPEQVGKAMKPDPEQKASSASEKSYKISVSELKPGDLIDEGTFAKVYKGSLREGIPVAIKRMKKTVSYNPADFLAEAS